MTLEASVESLAEDADEVMVEADEVMVEPDADLAVDFPTLISVET